MTGIRLIAAIVGALLIVLGAGSAILGWTSLEQSASSRFDSGQTAVTCEKLNDKTWCDWPISGLPYQVADSSIDSATVTIGSSAFVSGVVLVSAAALATRRPRQTAQAPAAPPST